MGAREITQKALAENVGVSQPAISGWLNGAMPDSKQLLALSEALGVSMDYLMKGLEGIRNPEVRERMAEEPLQSDLEVWRRRAKDAEAENAWIKENLRRVIAGPGRGGGEGTGKTMVEVVGHIADHLLEKGVDPAKLPPIERKARRRGASSQGTTYPRPSPKGRDEGS